MGVRFKRACANAFHHGLFWGSVLGMGAMVTFMLSGCQTTIPGQPSPASVAASAASAGLVAYRDALAAGKGRDDALAAAREAAIAYAVKHAGGAFGDYEPFVTLALDALILTVQAKGPESLPGDERVRAAIEDGIARAEAAK
jgi:hypothetical protein